ncbi:MAG: NifU family protein [Flavobacteriaceae bacterium]|nr:NifU family protein [Flavobacteriaceae bacterium]
MFQFTIATTDHPTRIRFVSNQPLGDDQIDFTNVDDAGGFPLIQQLFYLPFVKHVRLTENWIEVERFDILEWADVQDEVASQLADYLNQGGQVKKQMDQKEAISVYAESTPNPAVMKFVCSKRIVGEVYEAKNIDEAENSPLATELFHKPYVKEVFMDENFISITKYEIAEWEEIVQDLRQYLRDYVADNKAVVTGDISPKEKAPQITHEGTALEIIQIIDQHIKPAVASDGGNIVFDSYDEDSKSVQVILQGACSGCPSSTFTLKNGIEQLLRDMLPGKVEAVTAING